jgi:hypothetical protein
MRPFLPLVLLLSASLAVSACGDTDDGVDDSEQITNAIQSTWLRADPVVCTKFQTQTFMDQRSFNTGEAAIEECRVGAEDTTDDPEAVEVGDIEIDNDTATASIAFRGSALDGSTVTLAMVEEDNHWRIDRMSDIPSLDLEAFRRAFRSRIASAATETESCVYEAMAQAPEDQVKEALLSGSQETLVTLFPDCVAVAEAEAAGGP